MSLPLPPVLERHFLDLTYRGFEDLENDQKMPFVSNVEFLSIGNKSEGRMVELAWILHGEIFQKIRFKAFGDPYLIGSFSWLCFYSEGNSRESLSKLSLPQIAHDLEIPDHKLSCLMLLDDAIQHLLASEKR